MGMASFPFNAVVSASLASLLQSAQCVSTRAAPFSLGEKKGYTGSCSFSRGWSRAARTFVNSERRIRDMHQKPPSAAFRAVMLAHPLGSVAGGCQVTGGWSDG